MTDCFGIAATIISDRHLRAGAHCWIASRPGDPSSLLVLGISKGGRRIEKWVRLNRLVRLRAAWLPEELRDRVFVRFATKQEAQEAARELSMD